MAPAAANPWLDRRVLTYAHQCGAWEAPSSTLFALRRALALGVTGIELDVHATADRHLVVCHDSTVDRTTNGHGPIHSMTLAQVRELDNAYWFAPGGDETQDLAPEAYPYRGRGPGTPDFGVATLGEVLDVLEDHPHVALNLDIKQTAPAVEPYEELLARELAGRQGTGRVIVASFLDVATDSFAKFAPDIATSAGTLATAMFWRAVHQAEEPPAMAHAALQVPAVQGDLVVVDELLVTAAHECGMALHVWTINDELEMARLLELGVDGIISDLPTPLVAMVKGRGLAYVA
ncbi:MAG: glycerophosphodiester phosphodiesterase family protein [Acidimicrobiales bacterium]|nr:glycerophosphodiester phosphodiesterase family protein [Acidimicrobiales bacterium]